MRSKSLAFLGFLLVLIGCLLGSCAHSSREEDYGDAESMSINDSIREPVFESDSLIMEKAEHTEQKTIFIKEQKLRRTFESDSLSLEQLHVFQHRGQQKLDDFIDYVQIVSNKTYNKEMRLAAKEQMMQLFKDSTTMIEAGISEAREKAWPLFEFAQQIYNSKYDSIKIKVLYVKVKEPEKTPGGIYEGSVTANVSIKRYIGDKDVFSTMGTFVAGTVIQQVQKHFGSDSSTVWGVVLGEIKQLNVALQ